MQSAVARDVPCYGPDAFRAFAHGPSMMIAIGTLAIARCTSVEGTGASYLARHRLHPQLKPNCQRRIKTPSCSSRQRVGNRPGIHRGSSLGPRCAQCADNSPAHPL